MLYRASQRLSCFYYARLSRIALQHMMSVFMRDPYLAVIIYRRKRNEKGEKDCASPLVAPLGIEPRHSRL